MTTKFAQLLDTVHAPLDRGLVRALSLVLAFANLGLLMWNPHQYADRIGGFSNLSGIALIWAICSSMVFGLNFKPRFWLWQLVFSPVFSLIILIYLSILYW